jgi:anti-sigma factor (TIGR02949 family)
MNQCKEFQTQMSFYLDDELQGNERAALETHLRECEACRRVFDSERHFLDALRGSQPFHIAPPELRAKVEQVLADRPSPHAASPEFRNRIRWSLRQPGSIASSLVSSRGLAATATLLGFFMLIGLWVVTRERTESSVWLR